MKLVKHADGVDGLVLKVDGLRKGILGGVVNGYEALSNCRLFEPCQLPAIFGSNRIGTSSRTRFIRPPVLLGGIC